LTSEAKKKYDNAVNRLAGTGLISVWMDDVMITWQQGSADGTAAIVMQSSESARYLIAIINNGMLPFDLEISEVNLTDPMFGSGSLRSVAWAGLIAAAFVLVYLIWKYRVSGAVSFIALIGQAASILAFLTGYFGFSDGEFMLTLPGIIGVALAMGIGIGNQIFTNEHIKVQLQDYKSAEAALELGQKNVFAPVLWGNIAIASVTVLLMLTFGKAANGMVYSFGYTLLAGLVFNVAINMWLTGLMRKSLARFKMFRNKNVYAGGLDK